MVLKFGTLRRADYKYLESFEMLRWRGMARSCEIFRSITYSQEGEEYPAYNNTGLTGLVTCCVRTAF